MKKYKLHTHYKQILADTITPVSVYLKIRDKFPNSILLESSDYHANDNSFSYICFNPIASIKVENRKIETQLPDGFSEIIPIDADVNAEAERLLKDYQDIFRSSIGDITPLSPDGKKTTMEDYLAAIKPVKL